MPPELRGFRMPTAMTITGRSSSITNAFVNAIIPVVYPSEPEVAEALRILGMTPADVRCAYCGDPHTEWDHLRPLVEGQKPTGYISELANLVPCCSKCNQSKGKRPWREWIMSSAPRSPKSRGVEQLEMRIARLEQYEQWRQPQKLDFRAICGDELWEKHWNNWNTAIQVLKFSQEDAEKLRQRVLRGA
jgi:hypothetical protein